MCHSETKVTGSYWFEIEKSMMSFGRNRQKNCLVLCVTFQFWGVLMLYTSLEIAMWCHCLVRFSFFCVHIFPVLWLFAGSVFNVARSWCVASVTLWWNCMSWKKLNVRADEGIRNKCIINNGQLNTYMDGHSQQKQLVKDAKSLICIFVRCE